MTRRATLRLYGLIGLAVACFGASLGARVPSLAALGAMFAAIPAVGLVNHRWPDVQFSVAFEPSRAIEGDVIMVAVTVGSDRDVGWLEVELELPATVESADGAQRRLISLPAGNARVVRFAVRPTVWGLAPAGRCRLVARDRLGLFQASVTQTADAVARVYPSEGRLGGLVEPARTAATLGAHLSGERGDGCEYADVRPFRPGDRQRAVNWRVSARRGQLWVTERHPERSADVVLLVDDTSDVGGGADTTLRRAVRAARALAESHLAAQDRVGLVAVGAPLRWCRPRVGQRQLYVLVDVLLDCQQARAVGPSVRDLHVTTGLNAGTTVVALTSFGEPRVVDMLADLRRVGHHVVVVENPAVDVLPPPATVAETAARKLWALERQAVRQRLVALAIPTVAWDGYGPLDACLLGIRPRAGARR